MVRQADASHFTFEQAFRFESRPVGLPFLLGRQVRHFGSILFHDEEEVLLLLVAGGPTSTPGSRCSTTVSSPSSVGRGDCPPRKSRHTASLQAGEHVGHGVDRLARISTTPSQPGRLQGAVSWTIDGRRCPGRPRPGPGALGGGGAIEARPQFRIQASTRHSGTPLPMVDVERK